MEREIDDSLYSRQRYVLGDHAMHRMARSSVFINGLGGLGVEIAKNVILAGVKSVTLHDVRKASISDLGTQFFLQEDDVTNGRNRAEACHHRLAELNPYVTTNVSTQTFNLSSDLDFLKEYQCVVLTDTALEMQLKVDAFCRSQNPPIKFIAASVRGLFGSAFCDFGDEFEIVDQDGEEPQEVFISKITKAGPGIVTALENKMHGFQTGDHVKFREVKGMTQLNETAHEIKVESPFAFSICDTSGSQFDSYESGGIAVQVKVPTIQRFESLEKQIKNPTTLTVDFAKMERPLQSHAAFLALHQFERSSGRLPGVRDGNDAKELIRIAKEKAKDYAIEQEVDEKVVESLSFTAQGCFAPFAAALGGVVGQEVLKSLTGKFTPLNQWAYFDALEFLAEDLSEEQFLPKNDRYDALRICIGDELVQQLAKLKLFMVGCGAIGCEMLKNYALLGVATGPEGLITITDNDLIEKSNLNRQFLFRPRHIQQPKSTTAAASTQEINPAINIEAQQHKVWPKTESTCYPDAFFARQDLVVNALDNVEARRYVDSRCVTNQRALLESGTMGPKGHVQVVVPHLTESYSSQQDPPDQDVPYCTLKSFPAVIEHTIQWARDKFESSFTQKPQLYNKFWETHQTPATALQKFIVNENIEGIFQVSKMLTTFPSDWSQCVVMARTKFEKYFNHKAQNLLHKFPLTTRLRDGSSFWQSPKRPPLPQVFDASNQSHLDFVVSCARLYAYVFGIECTEKALSSSSLLPTLASAKVPEFRPSSKRIETDETVKKPGPAAEAAPDAVEACKAKLKAAVERKVPRSRLRVHPASFEKDDDSNGHIDFITAASNLRAEMYKIEAADRYKTKRIAGRIVPAIATTTAAIAGLVSLELLKVVKKVPLEHYKNVFLSLALPVVVFSEPAAAPRETIMEGLSYTLWDKWEVRGRLNFTLQDFMNHFKGRHGLEPSMVVFGVRMIYVPVMPGHQKRLPQPMLKLIKPADGVEYVDLTVSFGIPGSDEDKPIPPVRYYFQ